MTATDVPANLHRVGARPPLFRYLAEAWSRRDFALAMARFRIQASYESNRLGIVWVVLRPTLNALVYGVIFGVLQGEKAGHDYPAYVVIGVFLWEFFNRSLNDGAKSITGNRSLVQSLSFPRITLPVSVVLQQLLSLLPMLGVMALYLIILGHYPEWSWLLMVPLVLLFALFNAGIALIAARLTVHVTDLTQILPFVTRLLFYTSGVLFNVNNVLKDHPLVVRIYDYYPLYQVLQIARGSMMSNHPYELRYWGWFALWSVVVFVVGILFFWVAEERYGRD